MLAMAENIIARFSGWLKLDPVEDVWVNGMFHNICGSVTIAFFRGKFSENAKVEGRKIVCNIIIVVDENNGVIPSYEFRFNYLQDKTSVEYEPVYNDKDFRFIQDYRFAASKLELSTTKRQMGGFLTYLVQATHEAWMAKDTTFKSQNQVERLIPKSLGKLVLIRLPILVLLACITLEKLMLTIINHRYVPLLQTGLLLVGWATKKHRSIHLTQLQHQHLHTCVTR